MFKRHKNTKCWVNVESTKVNVDLTQVDNKSTKVDIESKSSHDSENRLTARRVNEGSTKVNNESMIRAEPHCFAISLLSEKNTVPIHLSLA